MASVGEGRRAGQRQVCWAVKPSRFWILRVEISDSYSPRSSATGVPANQRFATSREGAAFPESRCGHVVDLEARLRVLEGECHRFRGVAGVHPRPEQVTSVVRLARASERVVLVFGHDVGEPQRRDRRSGRPAHELRGHRLFDDLSEAVRVVRGGVCLIDRQERRRLIEREPHRRDAARAHDRADAGAMRGEQHVEGRRDVVLERRHIGDEPVHRNRGQVHDRVEAVVARRHAEERIEGLTVIGEVHAREPDPCRPLPVEADDGMAAFAEATRGRPAELAFAARDCDDHQPLTAPAARPFMICWFRNR